MIDIKAVSKYGDKVGVISYDEEADVHIVDIFIFKPAEPPATTYLTQTHLQTIPCESMDDALETMEKRLTEE